MRINLMYQIWWHFLFLYMLNLRKLGRNGYSDDVISFQLSKKCISDHGNDYLTRIYSKHVFQKGGQ